MCEEICENPKTREIHPEYEWCGNKGVADSVMKKGFRVVIEHFLNTPENYPPVIRARHIEEQLN
ncbi:hypothetical protein DOT_1473 [Desulfosporosinus sp. OT]|nr:hypothetical protein DOT_1473 [Desulfosporosinus sp. OT]